MKFVYGTNWHFKLKENQLPLFNYEINPNQMWQPLQCCSCIMPGETSGITRQHKPVCLRRIPCRERGFKQCPPCFHLHNRGCLQLPWSAQRKAVCAPTICNSYALFDLWRVHISCLILETEVEIKCSIAEHASLKMNSEKFSKKKFPLH